ncbi:MAG: hypothetical protein AAF587_33480 [Bacteroidota bacterium]
MKYLSIISGIVLLLWACDKGELLPNQPPETKIFLEDIQLAGADRLNSFVQLHWSGEDVDGYVAAYELSFDAQIWTLTSNTDSVFQLPLAVGQDTTDIDFYVRAIDNQDLADPDPAYLQIPIKNTPPTVAFDSTKTIPDSVLGAWSVLWSIKDSDGLETLDSVFVKINEGAWYRLDPRINFISLIPENATQAGEQALQLFAGASSELQPFPLEGARVGEENRMYLRARDIAGVWSEPDTSNAFFLFQQKGDLLVIDGFVNDIPDETYLPILDAAYPAYDYYNLIDNQPPFWDPTFGMLLSQYDKVFWYGDETKFDEQLLLELGSGALQQFLNQGGKIFVTTTFPSSLTSDPETANQSPIFSFSPMDSLSSASGQARIGKNDTMMVAPAFAADFPLLVTSTLIISADPFYSKDPQQDLYTTPILASGGWVGPSTVCAKSSFNNGETNQIFWSIDLYKLNGDPGNPMALEQLFSQVLQHEFDW